MMLPILRAWRDGKAMIFALPSYSTEGVGRVLVRCEMLGDDLFVTHESILTTFNEAWRSPFATAAVNEFLAYHPHVRFNNIVYEHKQVVLQPDWEEVPLIEKYQ